MAEWRPQLCGLRRRCFADRSFRTSYRSQDSFPITILTLRSSRSQIWQAGHSVLRKEARRLRQSYLWVYQVVFCRSFLLSEFGDMCDMAGNCIAKIGVRDAKFRLGAIAPDSQRNR